MKLFIDDMRTPPEGWTLARTINEAVKAIVQFELEEISLDHDIAHRITLDHVPQGQDHRLFVCQECYCAVCYFIGEKYFTDKKLNDKLNIARPLIYPKMTLHTANPAGALQMQGILNDYGIKSEIKPA